MVTKNKNNKKLLFIILNIFFLGCNPDEGLLKAPSSQYSGTQSNVTQNPDGQDESTEVQNEDEEDKQPTLPIIVDSTPVVNPTTPTPSPIPKESKWTPWGKWTDCSATCGGGTRNRIRQCLKLDGSTEGAKCIGDSTESEVCGTDTCKVENPKWTDWIDSGACSTKCGDGTKNQTRNCINENNIAVSDGCIGEATRTVECKIKECEPIIEDKWGDWSKWSACSVNCGQGTRSRSRECLKSDGSAGGTICAGESKETESCGTKRCPSDIISSIDSFTINNLTDKKLEFSEGSNLTYSWKTKGIDTCTLQAESFTDPKTKKDLYTGSALEFKSKITEKIAVTLKCTNSLTLQTIDSITHEITPKAGPVAQVCEEEKISYPATCKIGIAERNNIWSNTGGWNRQVARFVDQQTFWISSTTRKTNSRIYCSALPSSKAQIMISNFKIESKGKYKVQMLHDNFGSAYLLKDADPTKGTVIFEGYNQGQMIEKVIDVKDDAQLGFYSVIMEVIDTGVASGGVFSVFKVDDNNVVQEFIKKTSDDGSWCIFQEVRNNYSLTHPKAKYKGLLDYVRKISSCKPCLVGEEAVNSTK